MADPEVVVDTQTPQEDDTEMQNVPDITVDESMAGGSGEGDEAGLEDIEPTNNAAERALRPAVLWRKGSLGSDSEVGVRVQTRG